jgi:hypothetical protein
MGNGRSKARFDVGTRTDHLPDRCARSWAEHPGGVLDPDARTADQGDRGPNGPPQTDRDPAAVVLHEHGYGVRTLEISSVILQITSVEVEARPIMTSYFMVVNAIWAFVGVFALVYTVTEGGPGYGATPLDLMIYRRAFEFGEMGYASAMSVLLSCLVLLISAIQLVVFDRLTTD